MIGFVSHDTRSARNRCFGVGAGIFFNAKGVEQRTHGVHKAHGQEDQVCRNDFLSSRNFNHAPVLELHVHSLQAGYVTVLTHKGLGGDGEHALTTLFVRGAGSELHGPVGPSQWAVFLCRRLRHHFKLSDRFGAVAVAGSHTVTARVATTNDHHVLAVSPDLALQTVACVDLVLLGQEFHGEMNALQVPTFNGEVAGYFRASAQQHSVVLFDQVLGLHVFFGPVGDFAALRPISNQDSGFEDHAFGFHLLHAAIDVGFLHLEVRNAVAQEAAHAVVFLKHHDVVAHTCELLRGCKPRRTGTHDRHFLACFVSWLFGLDPTLTPTLVNDGVLNGFDADSIRVHIECACGLARSGTNATCEFREIVGRVQHIQRFLPVALEDQVVEVRNDVVDWAAVVAKRRAAIHAPGPLLLGRLVIQSDDELFVILNPIGNGLVALFDAINL